VPVWSYQGKLILVNGGIAGNENCCCDQQDVCPCLTHLIPEPLTSTRVVPPISRTIQWPCHQDLALFWGPIEMCGSFAPPCCIHGIQYEDAYRITQPPYTDLIDSCEVSGANSAGICCDQVDMWYPGDLNPPPDCGPSVPQCPSGQFATVGSAQIVSLCYDCSDPQNIVSTASWYIHDPCFGFSGSWFATRDLGPGPVDPEDGFGTYRLSWQGQPLPLPANPYAELRMMAQHFFDVTDGIVMTIGP
jgi:hypothetical protein